MDTLDTFEQGIHIRNRCGTGTMDTMDTMDRVKSLCTPGG